MKKSDPKKAFQPLKKLQKKGEDLSTNPAERNHEDGDGDGDGAGDWTDVSQRQGERSRNPNPLSDFPESGSENGEQGAPLKFDFFFFLII